MGMFDEETKQLRLRLYRAAAEMLEAYGHEAEVRESYSGRGMYGAEVPGIVTDVAGTLVGWAIGAAAAEDTELGPIESCDLLNLIPQRQDSMGLSTIYY